MSEVLELNCEVDKRDSLIVEYDDLDGVTEVGTLTKNLVTGKMEHKYIYLSKTNARVLKDYLEDLING